MRESSASFGPDKYKNARICAYDLMKKIRVSKQKTKKKTHSEKGIKLRNNTFMYRERERESGSKNKNVERKKFRRENLYYIYIYNKSNGCVWMCSLNKYVYMGLLRISSFSCPLPLCVCENICFAVFVICAQEYFAPPTFNYLYKYKK